MDNSRPATARAPVAHEYAVVVDPSVVVVFERLGTTGLLMLLLLRTERRIDVASVDSDLIWLRLQLAVFGRQLHNTQCTALLTYLFKTSKIQIHLTYSFHNI